MASFESIHQSRVVGSLAMFDRMIFKGLLLRLYHPGGAGLLVEPRRSPHPVRRVGQGDGPRRCASTPSAAQRKQDGRTSISNTPPLATPARLRRTWPEASPSATASPRAWCASCERWSPASRSSSVATTPPTASTSSPASAKCVHHYWYFIDPELGFIHIRCRAGFPSRSRSMSTAGSGWPDSSTPEASATCGPTTRCCASTTSRSPASCASASPTGPGPDCSMPWPDG
jgi:hypothetical protein